MDENRPNGQTGRIAQWLGVAVSSAIAVGGALTFSFNIYDGIRTDVAACSVTTSRLDGHIQSDAEMAGVIHQRLAYVEQRLDLLQSRADARPDPFTGTEGRALADKIGRLEHRIEKLETR